MRRSSRRETGKNPISAPTNTSRNCKLPSTNSSKKVLNKANAASLGKTSFAPIPNQLALFPGVPPEAKMVFLWLCGKYQHEEIGSKLIAEAFGCGQRNVRNRLLAPLLEARMVKVVRVGRKVTYEPNPVELWVEPKGQ